MLFVYVRRFLYSLWADWVALMSGVASLLLAIYAAVSNADIPPRAFWSTALVCLLISMFRVWLNESTRADSLSAELRDREQYNVARERLAGYMQKMRELRNRSLSGPGDVPAWIDEVNQCRQQCGTGISECLSQADAYRVFSIPALPAAHAMNAKNPQHNAMILELDYLLKALQSLFDQLPRS